MIEKLTNLIETQLHNAESDRRDAIKREEKMQQLLDTALNKPADKDREEKMQQLIEAALTRQQGGSDQTPQASKIPNNATPAPVLVQNASLREFSTWKQKLFDYMLLTGIDKASNDKKKAVLRSLLDDEWFRIAKFAIDVKMEDPGTTVETVL